MYPMVLDVLCASHCLLMYPMVLDVLCVEKGYVCIVFPDFGAAHDVCLDPLVPCPEQEMGV